MNQETVDDNITQFSGADLPDIPVGQASSISARETDRLNETVTSSRPSRSPLMWLALLAGILVAVLFGLRHVGVIDTKLPFLPQSLQEASESSESINGELTSISSPPPLPQQQALDRTLEAVSAPIDFPINRQPAEAAVQPATLAANDVWSPANVLSVEKKPLAQTQAPAQQLAQSSAPSTTEIGTTSAPQSELQQLKHLVDWLQTRVDSLTLKVNNLESQLAQAQKTQGTQKSTAHSKPAAPITQLAQETKPVQPVPSTPKPSVPAPKKPALTQKKSVATDLLHRLKLVSAKQIGGRVIVKFKARGQTVRLSIGDRYNGWALARVDLRRGEALFTKGHSQKVIQL